MIQLTKVNLQLDIPRKKTTTSTTGKRNEANSNKPASKKINFLLEGQLNNIETSIECKLADSPIAKVLIKVKDTTVEDFLKSWNLDSSDLPTDQFPMENLLKSSISVNVNGLYNTRDKHFQLVVKFTYNDEAVDLNVNLIVNKPPGSALAVALVVKLDNIENVVEYLKKKINYDGPDFIKSLFQSATLSISSKSINLTEYDDFLTLDGNVQKSIESGLHVYIETDMQTALKNCAKEKGASNVKVNFNKLSHKKETIYTIDAKHSKKLKTKNAKKNKQASSNASKISKKISSSTSKNNNQSFAAASKNNKQAFAAASKNSNQASTTDSNTQSSEENEQNDNLIKITFLRTGIVVKLPKGFSEDLVTVMKCFLNEMKIYVHDVVLPEILDKQKQTGTFHISELRFLKEEYKITLAYTGEISLPFNLKLSNPKFTISKKKVPDQPWVFRGFAEVISEALTDTTNKGSIDFEFDTNLKFKVNINIPFLEIKSLGSFFGAQPFEGSVAYLESSFSFGIKNLYIDGVLDMKNSNGELTITASPEVNGMTGLTLGVFIWKLKTPSGRIPLGIAFGLVLKNVRLDHALKRFANVEMSASWLSDISIVMLVSTANKNYCKQDENKDLPECKKPEQSSRQASVYEKRAIKSQTAKNRSLESKEATDVKTPKRATDVKAPKSTHFETINDLKDIEVVEGLILKASAELKSEERCMENSICLFLVQKGFQKLSLKGTITRSDFRIEASIEGSIDLSGTLTLKNIMLVLNFGASGNSISIESEFHMKNPELVFTGYIKIELSGKLSVGGSMRGMIKEPFNVQRLAFGNVYFAFGLDLKTLLPTIEMGAQIWFGKLGEDEKSDRFEFQGYFGLSASNPTDSYIYFISSGADLTIGNIYRIFEINKELPENVAASGFIGELRFSVNFGTAEKTIEKLDVTIPPGFMFKGIISIWGYNIDCEIKISSSSFYLKALFDPMTGWGNGAIDLYRDADNHGLGPFLLVNVDKSTFEVCIRGYVRFHGIKASLDIQIDETHLSFKAHGNLFDVLTMEVEVTAQYSKENGLENLFFNGCVSTSVIEEIQKAAIEYIEEAKRKAQATLDKAKKVMEDAKADITGVQSKIQGWKSRLDDYRQKLEARKLELEKEREQLSGNCFKECGTVCVPFFGWVSHCTTLWGYPVGCLKWDSCKWKAPNIICIAACEIKRGFQKFTSWVETLGIQIMQGITSIGDLFSNAATAILEAAKGIVTLGQRVVDLANKVAQGVLSAIQDLLNIRIDGLCLHAEYDPNKKTCAGASLKITYHEQQYEYKGSMCFDSSAFKSLGSKAATKADPKADHQELDSGAAKVDAEANKVLNECNKIHQNLSNFEKDAEHKKVSIENLGNQPKRSHIFTKGEIYRHQHIYDPSPKVNLRNDEINSLMKNAVPWEYFNIEDTGSKIAQFQKNLSVRHLIPDEESLDLCHQRQNVLSRYSTIADSFSSAINNVKKVKEGYMYKKRSFLNEIDHLNSLVHSQILSNMTFDEQQDILEWRDYTDYHIKSYLDKAASVFETRKRDSINNVRQAINDAIENDRGVKFPEYIKYLHSLAVKPDKKSQINKQLHSDNSVSLHYIKEILLNVVSDDRISTLQLAKGIDKVQKMLSDMKRSSIPCAA
ncbi:uncharacterized protein LOC100199786 isoform X2 [Hydra vulgaris]|nr:uncharacterized protein LOC100199786 isoform X2 [Hydra vulgaris]